MQTQPESRHQVLRDLASDLEKGFIEDTFEVHGRRWTLRTLNDGEETWSDKFVAASNSVAIITTRRAAKLSVAIQAVNDVQLKDLFTLPESNFDEKKVKEYIESNSVRHRFWLAEQMYEYLSEQPANMDGLVIQLHAKFMELEKRVKEVSENLKN